MANLIFNADFDYLTGQFQFSQNGVPLNRNIDKCHFSQVFQPNGQSQVTLIKGDEVTIHHLSPGHEWSSEQNCPILKKNPQSKMTKKEKKPRVTPYSGYHEENAETPKTYIGRVSQRVGQVSLAPGVTFKDLDMQQQIANYQRLFSPPFCQIRQQFPSDSLPLPQQNKRTKSPTVTNYPLFKQTSEGPHSFLKQLQPDGPWIPSSIDEFNAHTIVTDPTSLPPLVDIVSDEDVILGNASLL